MPSATVSRPCPVCEERPAETYLQKGELRLMCCAACRMVYVKQVPLEFASGDYYDRAGAEYYLSPAKLESDYARVRFARELRLFGRHCDGGDVLDVGCSSGAFLYQLGRRFPGRFTVVGTDVSGPALDYAESRGIPVVRGNFLQLDFSGKRFDAVTFWAVLEHLLEPKKFLEKAASILKPGGFCFVLVPNLQSLAVRLLGARYRYIYPQHLNYFTRATLERLAAGPFSVVGMRSMHFNPLVIWQDWRSGGADVSNQQRGALLQRTTAYKQSPWLKPVRLTYAAAESTLAAFNLADNLAVVLLNR